jgi:homospermidine synthase
MNKKILVIGYGSVSQCVIPLLFRHLEISYTQVTIIDFEDKREALQQWIQKGVHYFQEKILPETMQETLKNHVNTGDIILDLAWNINTLEILQWCHDHHVLYLNTSVEEWDPFDHIHEKPIMQKTLYWRQMRIRDMISTWKDKSVTAIVDHGANPGLISHFSKQGLMDIAEKCLSDNTTLLKKNPIETALDNQDFAHLAMHLGVKVIHCSERDRQRMKHPKTLDEFVNTWSIEGLIEEGMAPAEMGWGTHEKTLPPLAHQPQDGPKNQIFLAQMGMNTWVRSWIPSQEILGMVIRHGEAFGISDRLTVWENGQAIYRPTVHYAYMPSNETLVSLHELRARNYVMQPYQRIVGEEVVAGDDTLGALIMGHPYGSWWTGSILSIEESRRLVPNQNATTVQVAIGVIAALLWMLENPEQGFCLPDDLPYAFVLNIAKPYLGQFLSISSDWTPKMNYQPYFNENVTSALNEKNLWGFENFCFQP